MKPSAQRLLAKLSSMTGDQLAHLATLYLGQSGHSKEKKKPKPNRSALTIGQAADYLGESKTTIARNVQETKRLARHGLPNPKGIRFKQTGGKGGWLRFDVNDLDAWKAAQTIDPAEPPRIPPKPVRRRQRAEKSPPRRDWAGW